MNNRVYLYNTGSYARERLVTMLASDRIGCNPDFINSLKNTIKNELEKYINLDESDIDIYVKERMLIAYIPIAGRADNNIDNNTDNTQEYTTTTGQEIGQGTVKYEVIEERAIEFKTIQS